MGEGSENKDGFPTRVDEETLDIFHDDGYVILSNLLPASILEEWQVFAHKSHGGMDFVDWIFRELHIRGHTPFPEEKKDGQYALGHGVKNGFCEIVSRSTGRYEISLLNLQKHADKLESPPSLDRLLNLLEEAKIHSLLSQSAWEDKIKVINTSLIISTPDSSTQGWHADGGHINLQEHLPCHVLNVFIPLQDMTTELGPTQFRPGTHVYTRNLGPMMLAAKCRKTLRPPVTPLLKAGDALCFDYRILHRGLANTSSSNTHRIMLCVTVAQEWYNDLLNFPKRSMFASRQEELRNQIVESSENKSYEETTEDKHNNGGSKDPPANSPPDPIPAANSEDEMNFSSPSPGAASNGDRTTRKNGGNNTGGSAKGGAGPFDEAPCIHFPKQQSGQYHIRQEHGTPQYIATLQPQTETMATAERPSDESSQSLAPIMIASLDEGVNFLVQPLDKGRAALWNTRRLMQSWKESEENHHLFNNLLKADLILDAKQHKSVSWLEFVQAPSSLFRGQGHKPNLYLLGLLSTGMVFLFSVHGDIPFPKKEVDAKPSESQYKILTSWQMGDGRVTCIGVTSSGIVLVGDEKGNLFASHLQQQKPRSSVTVSHIWEGSFDHGYSIQSIVQFPNPNESTNDALDTTSDECIAVTVQSSSRVASPMQLEVINVSAISRKAESGTSNTAMQKSTKGNGKSRLGKVNMLQNTVSATKIPLEDFWVLPEPGWELVDADVIREKGFSTSHSLSIRTVHWIATQGSHRLCGPLDDGKVALALSDGTGAFISVKKQPDGQMSWGVANSERHQWLMSFPSIGMGSVQLPSNSTDNDSAQPHLACALRGGTVYLIPAPTSDSKDAPGFERNVKVIVYPDDIEDDTPRQSLQSFTASNVTFDNKTSVPVLFFCWPGGIIDIYACHLLKSTNKDVDTTHEHPLTEDEAITNLISNGTAAKLKLLLDKVSQKLLATELVKSENESADLSIWRKAARELMEVQNPQLTSSELHQWPSFRSLLLKLSDPSYNFESATQSLQEIGFQSSENNDNQ